MSINGLLFMRDDDCIDCPAAPECNCPGQQCYQIIRGCDYCDSIKCVPYEDAPAAGSGGVSKGAVAGAVVAVIILLAVSVLAFLWYRRRNERRRAQAAFEEGKAEVPAAADTVLNRPDPAEKPPLTPTTDRSNVRVYSSSSNTTIDLDPESAGPTQHAASALSQRSDSVRSENPFDDNNSIQTAGTEGTNVIPIALVAPDGHRQSQTGTGMLSTTSSVPSRPARSPDLDINTNRLNAALMPTQQQPSSADNRSQISGTGVNRNSYMSSASYASEFLNEAPMIMTPMRQVLGGMGKAEFVNASAGSSEVNLLKIPGPATKPAIRSPLAASSFTSVSSDGNSVSDAAGQDNPFSDKHFSTTTTQDSTSPPATASGFQRPSTIEEEPALLPWDRTDDYAKSRPTSMNTQAGSVLSAGIESATRVNVGMMSPKGKQVMGRYMSPNSPASNQLQEQQRRAVDSRLQKPAEADLARRKSSSSAFSGTADSILESFPFAMPTSQSQHDISSSHTPPGTPSRNQPTHFITPPTPEAHNRASHASDESELPAPPNRRTLGLSTGSQFSTASSGLGSFPFQIDSGGAEGELSDVPTDRQRASLDTLAITSDLSSYPLGYDRDVPPVPKK